MNSLKNNFSKLTDKSFGYMSKAHDMRFSFKNREKFRLKWLALSSANTVLLTEMEVK